MHQLCAFLLLRATTEYTMRFYTPQDIYRKLNQHHLRLGIIQTVKALGQRHLLVRIDTNDACNLRCVMCYFSDPDRKPNARPMGKETFASIAEQLFGKTRYLYMSCGTEPFVTSHFDQLLDIAGQYDLPFISYCTNGILMKDKFIDATLRNRVNEVIFSIDGGTKETYEKIRVGAKWDVFNDRVRAFYEARKQHNGPVPALRFNYTIQEGNCHELETFLDWSLQWQPQVVQLRLFRTIEGASKQYDSPVSVQALEEALPKLQKKADAAGIHLLAMDTPEERKAKVGDTASPFEGPMDGAQGHLNKVNCQLPWFNLYITANGDVRPCTVHEPVGNFNDSSFAEIVHGDAMRDLKASMRKNPKTTCINCQLTGASGV